GTRALAGVKGAVPVHVHTEGDGPEGGDPIRRIEAVDADARTAVAPETAVLPAVEQGVAVGVRRVASDLITGPRKRQGRSRVLACRSSRHLDGDQLTEERGTGGDTILCPERIPQRGLEPEARRVVRHTRGIDHPGRQVE